MFVPATSKAIHRQAFIGDIAQTWFSICSPPAWRTRWFIYCISNRISMVKVIHIAYLSFRLFTDFASAEIVYSFCILWQCKKSNFQKGQFSISLLRRSLCTRNNILRIYGPQIALCTFWILQRTPDTCHNHHTRWAVLLDPAQSRLPNQPPWGAFPKFWYHHGWMQNMLMKNMTELLCLNVCNIIWKQKIKILRSFANLRDLLNKFVRTWTSLWEDHGLLTVVESCLQRRVSVDAYTIEY